MMNFPNFPLYQSLKHTESDVKELTTEEKDKFLDFVKDTEDKDKREIIFALIRAYHLDHDISIQEIPYGGKNLKGGLKFDFDCLPSKLQHMLYIFSNFK
jgi:hypothetical protein